MKRTFLIMTVLFLIFGLAASAGATLTDNLDGTVTDDDRGDGTALMWLQTPGPDLNFNDAVAWADSLVFAGYDDWRLPSALDFTSGLPDDAWYSTNNEFGNLYGVEFGELFGPNNSAQQGPLSDYTDVWYWTSTVDPGSSADAFAFFWSWDGVWLNQTTLGYPLLTIESVIHVTAVREGGAGAGEPVPEPATMLLLGSGLLGLAGFRRRFRKC